MKKNEGGFLTLDFIFALTIVAGFSVVLFALTFTLSIVEVVQYMTFSAARSFYSAHFSPQEQINAGATKFLALKESPPLKPLFRKDGWFELEEVGTVVGDFSSIYEAKAISSTTEGFSSFHGARVRLVANLLNLRFPIIGSTSDGGKNFKANVASYLSREPSTQECMSFVNQRLQRMMSIQGANYSGAGKVLDADYIRMADNGC